MTQRGCSNSTHHTINAAAKQIIPFPCKWFPEAQSSIHLYFPEATHNPSAIPIGQTLSRDTLAHSIGQNTVMWPLSAFPLARTSHVAPQQFPLAVHSRDPSAHSDWPEHSHCGLWQQRRLAKWSLCATAALAVDVRKFWY